MNDQYSLQSIEFDPFAGPEIEKAVPAIEPQIEIWTSYLIGGEDANRSYNESVSLWFEGSLNQAVLEKALSDLINRHEALRSGFSADGKQLCVFKDIIPNFKQQDLSHQNEERQKQLIANFVIDDANTSFDILAGPLFRVNLFNLGDSRSHLTLSAHHIICDGWSMAIIMQDLGKLYSAYVKASTPDLPEAPSFADYAIRQKQFHETPEYKAIENYWLSQYENDIPVLDIPTDHLRPEVKTYKSHRDDFELDPMLVTAIKKLGSQVGCSFVTTMLVAFEVFLHKISGQEEIILGIPSAGQSVEGNNGLVGHCVNMLPVRSHHNPETSFLDFLKGRKPAILDAYENQQFTFGTLLKKIGMLRDTSRVPLIPVVFNIDIGLDEDVKFEGLSYKLSINKREFENFEIFLNASGSGNALTLEWSYNTQLFEAGTIKRMMEDFASLLNAVVENPQVNICDIPMRGSDKLNQTFYDWNKTLVEYPSETPVHTLIEQKAQEFPQKVAFNFQNESYTYRELNESANRLAGHLLSYNIGAGDCVGLATNRSAEMLISLLAILKTGAAYVPLDPGYPRKTIEFMLSDSSAKLLITTSEHKGKFNGSIPEILLDQERENIFNYPSTDPDKEVKGDDLAYIIYTSGTSGQPKGTQIEHRSLVNFLYSMQKAPGITRDDCLLAVTTISFDIAGLELYLPLITGATLVIADTEATKDGRILAGLIRSEKITIMQATPSTFRMMIEGGWDTSGNTKILCGGEALPLDLANKLLVLGSELWNMYGPTETTIWSAIKRVDSDNAPIAIGHPIDNTRIYILDGSLKPVMPGLSGEIYIAGDGLARGYLNQPELTAGSFIADPFSANKKDRIYRTGDLGKFNADGEIIYLGRIDNQIKLRGHRIELGSIEYCLNSQPNVKESVVLVREDRPGDPRLVSYMVLKENEQYSESPSWLERWEDLYSRAIASESDLDLADQQLDIAITEHMSDRSEIRKEAEEWLEKSIKRIKDINARNVMELGSGGGQLVFALAHLYENFTATDYAETAINKLNEKLLADPVRWQNVKAFTAPADDFSMVNKNSLDLVIINSVVQYFPDAPYLIKVIQEAAKAVKSGGCIYIGDMQSKSTLEIHHAADQLNRSDNQLTVAEFKNIVSRRVSLEDELTADPDFFYLLPDIIPAIKSVNIQLREGRHDNEITKYHYDVWLYINSEKTILKNDINLTWQPEFTLRQLSGELEKNQSKIIALSGIMNSRTTGDCFLQQILKENDDKDSVMDLKIKTQDSPEGLNPDVFWDIGNRSGFNAHVRWTSDGTDGLFEVIFIPKSYINAIPYKIASGESDMIYDYIRNPITSNITLSGDESSGWIQLLGEVLPAYMIPNEFVIVKKIPLLPNGKIDRKALPKPEERSAGDENKKLPRNETEKLVSKIWGETLGIGTVGVDDDFFELGGHSLVAMQVMMRMEKETGIRLPLTTLFRNSSLEQFASLFLQTSE